MKAKSVLCDNCHQPMDLLSNKLVEIEKGNRLRKIRKRRFKCDICNITKAVFSNEITFGVNVNIQRRLDKNLFHEED